MYPYDWNAFGCGQSDGSGGAEDSVFGSGFAGYCSDEIFSACAEQYAVSAIYKNIYIAKQVQIMFQRFAEAYAGIYEYFLFFYARLLGD